MRFPITRSPALPSASARNWIIFTAILGLATALYCYQLGYESLWFDEAYSIESAQGPLNFNRPLYFLLLRLWMRIGIGEAWLRSLSVLFGLASVALIYGLGCRLAGKTTGRIAALLLTLSPLAINHAQEIRFYTLSLALGLAGSLALSIVLENASTPLRLKPSVFWWLGARFLGILTAQVNILLLLPDALLLGFKIQQRYPWQALLKRGFWLLGLVAGVSVWVLKDVVPPLLEFMQGAPTLNGRPLQAPGPVNFVGALATFTAWPLRSPVAAWAGFYSLFFKVYAIVVVLVLLWGLVRRSQSTHLGWAAAWGLLPLAAIFTIAQFSVVFWRDRYLLITAPYILILLAAGLEQIWHQRRGLALLLIGLYGIAVGSSLVRYYTVDNNQNWRGFAQTLQKQAQPGDALIVYPDFFAPVLTYYYQGSLPRFAVDNRDAAITQQTILDIVARHQRTWLALDVYDNWGLSENQILKTLGQKGYRTIQRQETANQWGETIGLSLVKTEAVVPHTLSNALPSRE